MVEITRVCANPGCDKAGKHLCSGCGGEIYCSRDCQKAHWSVHKQTCKSSVKPEAAMFIKSFDELSVKQLKNIMIAKATTFDPSKKDKILKKVDSIVEKPALVRLVKEHVSPEEIEPLLTTPASVKAEAAANAQTTSSSGNVGPGGKNKKMVQKMQFEANQTPSPDQLRQQAAFMRKNPGMVRKAQAALAHLTDEQIRQYADQLEMTAANPEMMKEVEKMSKLNEKDRNLLQTIQEGLSGVKPIDDKWISEIVDAIKNKPDIFKTMFKGKGAMFGGVTDEQIDSYIDMASRMDKWMLKLIAYAIWYMSKAAKPLSEWYKKADEWTFGTAKYILMLIGFLVLYYISMFVFAVVKFIVVRLYRLVMLVVGLVSGNSKQKLAEQAASKLASTVDGEFADAAASTISKVGSAAAAAAGAQAAANAMNNAAAAGGAAAGTNNNKQQAASAAKKQAADEFEF